MGNRIKTSFELLSYFGALSNAGILIFKDISEKWIDFLFAIESSFISIVDLFSKIFLQLHFALKEIS